MCIGNVMCLGTNMYLFWPNMSYFSSLCKYKIAYNGSISTFLTKKQYNVVNDGVQIGVPNSL